MALIGDLNKQRQHLVNECREIVDKVKDVQYRMKVAEVQNDEQQKSGLNAEAVVLNQMMKEKSEELEKINAEVDGQKAVFEAEAANANLIKNVAFVAAILCFWMPTFNVGLVYLLICLAVGFYFSSKANDQKAYAAGYSESEWKQKKKEISQEIDRKNRDRDDLARSIAEHLKK